VYVYLKPPNGWRSTSRSSAQLAASDGRSNNVFGGSVAVSGNTLIPGAYGWNSEQGAAYVFGP
ncbi:MAG TPA: FG-GAP repeat protein, partial [Terriglobales bacterium]